MSTRRTNYRLAAAQMNCVLADVACNLETHRRVIESARHREVDVLVFPELSLTGYNLGARVPEVAMDRDDPRLLQLADAAGDMLTVVGFVERCARGEYANAMACLCEGRVVAVHRKLNLCTYGGHEEGKHFGKGQTLTVTDADGLACGVMICADLWNPGLAHAAMLERPDVMLAPVNAATGMVDGDFDDEGNWLICLKFYAMMYATPMVMAHRYGAEGDGWFWGGSCIVGVDGRVLARAEDSETLVSADIDTDEIDAARFAMPTHRDADTPLVASLMAQRLERERRG
ncbi:nitrilase-related carbon-nitrogen hydrolase [Chromohalobacter israelensis]|uniref:Nitrilase/cyanide hydratase and apolipoprotein N-acyltransferase n=1 Tax=Chromohalobacter israelensis (strain ATCC BAA-138 / DSM 3043 / CIP 106854 / NCIMB 13768 / 1H11) TaxID=290398 RepID=Q1QV07_CHRI1|nr:nitrilase-related carbon-nitrogen hydrolase [Chromohalobacter salexigens]ABE59701.1 Nitrilase/cyanide hydratase and apolipoprotein N-acyltransferase [Chromohalobacter salexigens DSM 3043]